MYTKYVYNDEERNYYSFEKKDKKTGGVEIEIKVNFSP